MTSISNIRPTQILGSRPQTPVDIRKSESKDRGTLSATTPQGLSLAQGTNDTKTNELPGTSQAEGVKARLAAEGLVSATFIEPILKQVRESNNTPPPFGPSSAEKQFSSLLDTKLADEIVKAANFPLVERITAQLLKNMPQTDLPTQAIDTKG